MTDKIKNGNVTDRAVNNNNILFECFVFPSDSVAEILSDSERSEVNILHLVTFTCVKHIRYVKYVKI